MASLKRFLASASVKLAATYLSIIMVMSIGFSVVFYHTSSHELGRQLPPDSLFSNNQQTTDQHQQPMQVAQTAESNHAGSSPQLNKFFKDRIDEGRSSLLMWLLLVNVSALLVGSVLSYLLARWTLRPIEAAMEAQVQFVSDASHELRTPLTAIQTSNEVFLRRPKQSIAAARTIIEQNIVDIARLKQLSDGLLSLAKPADRSLQLARVELQTVASEALTQIVPQATAKAVSVQDELGKQVVFGDQALLVQVLVVLLDNAVKYSPDNGTVQLQTVRKGKYVHVQVKDEGIGIAAADMPHIFQRFYRADTARTSTSQSGYGLGLAIAKQLIERQHGTISVISQPGQGSTFTIKLLAAEG